MTDTKELVKRLRYGADHLRHEAADTIERLEKERDAWKQSANEYQECLQPLIMDVLYNHCKPVSYGWPGKKHVDGIREGVEFLLKKLTAARKVVEAAKAYRVSNTVKDHCLFIAALTEYDKKTQHGA